MPDVLRLPQTDQVNLQIEVQAAITAVQLVHWVSDLPPLDVHFTDANRFGGYMPASEEHPRRMEISSLGLTPRLTTVHEFGHFLDDAVGRFEVYSSQELNSPVSRVIVATERTQTIRDLREYEYKMQGAFSPERGQVVNRLEEVEIWARAYAQYIAIRSGDVQLLAEIQARRDIETGILKNEQWDWEDFAPIALEIDTLMRRLGWLL